MTADNDLILCPLAGYSTATMEGGTMLLLEFVRREEELSSGVRHTLRLAMTRAQARALGQAVLRSADAPHMDRPPTGAKN